MRRDNNTFNCFSPPVMIATFAIEILFLLYVIIRYKMSSTGRIIAGALLCLATFQYAEFHVCEAIGTADYYSRLGYVAITMLPPLGVHLVSKLADRPNGKLVGAAYATGILFAASFVLSPQVFNSYACVSNYAIFHLTTVSAYLYSIFYYGWLLTGIGMCLKFRKDADPNTRTALNMQAIGYLSFMVPTGIANLVNPATMDGIPSIMCGFAVIYAGLLVFKIAPVALQQKPLPEVFSRNNQA